ncbi:type III secretion system stator protein SctL [Kosakonia oryzae]|uniref:Type III secretion protein L n=1 Tax=Kosakonia oryzae TaxID=497725 RepID=A0AA94H5Q9_9ENTR|nr:type III secretion system stator protein SctL [Kosakonia oryzae]ANI81300.1 type III secretion system stator protein SctL [Kosakonia oryzae]SFC87657.1 type III secretion protein L [Kosakonia oryzae]
MWKIREIVLPPSLMAGEGAIVPREVLDEHRQAQALLRQAEQEAGQILAAAREEAERQVLAARAECEMQFLQNAETVLEEWRQARAQQEENLVSQAQQLVSAVFVHLFARTSDEQKISALLRQILQAQTAEKGSSATLWCHPSQFDAVGNWLQAHASLDWLLQTDDALETHQLRLQTTNGELSVNWEHLQQRLLNTLQA